MLRFTGYILSVPKNSFSSLYGIHQQSRLLLLRLFFSSRFNQCRAADGWTLEEMRMVSLNIYLLDFVPVELQLHADHCLDPKQLVSQPFWCSLSMCSTQGSPICFLRARNVKSSALTSPKLLHYPLYFRHPDCIS